MLQISNKPRSSLCRLNQVTELLRLILKHEVYRKQFADDQVCLEV